MLSAQWIQSVANGAVLLTVNQRLARHLINSYQCWQVEQGALWWDTPKIMPWRAWLQSLHDEALALGISSHSRLPDLLQQRQWLKCVEADTRLQLLEPEAAAAQALQAWQLSCAWRCQNDENSYLSEDQFAWQRWRQRYLSHCDANTLIDDAMLPDHLLELMQGGQLKINADGSPSMLILAGFLQVSPQQLAFTDALQSSGVTVEYWQPEPIATVRRQLYADDDGELLGIATAARKSLEGNFNQSLGIVISDLHQRRARVLRTFDGVFFPGMSPDEIQREGRPYDISLGLPLSEQSVVRSGLNLIKLIIGTLNSSELSALLLSPYLKNAKREARSRERLDRKLREDRVRKLTVSELADRLQYGGLHRGLREVIKQRRMSSKGATAWAAQFSRWLKLCGWPGSSNDSEEYQAIGAFYACLDDVEVLDDGEKISAGRAFAQLSRLCRERIFQVETPSTTPIQIMGRLESHGIVFDELWIPGMDSDQWPPVANATPFLSIAEQKRCGIAEASASSRLQQAYQEYQLWCSQTAILHCSSVQQRDGKEVVAARLPALDDGNVDHNLVPVPGKVTADDHPNAMLATARYIGQSAAPLLEQLPDFHGPVLEPGSAVRGGARLFENQAKCPFRAFALHRLQVRPLEEPGLGLDARQHGNLLHKALEIFWQQVVSHEQLMSMDAEQLEQTLGSSIEAAMQHENVAGALGELERPRLLRLLREWLVQCEMPRQPFEVIELERKTTIEHGGIEMNVTLDRIDRVNGADVVVDYKTGTSNAVKSWGSDRIENPQLPLYVLTDDMIAGVSFAQVARHQCGFKGIARDDQLLPRVGSNVRDVPISEWSDWRLHWQQALDVVAEEVRAGLATVTPMQTACKFCELKTLCRIDEAASDIPSPEPEDGASAVVNTRSVASTLSEKSTLTGHKPAAVKSATKEPKKDKNPAGSETGVAS